MLPLTSYFSLVPQDNYDLLFLSQYLTPSLCVHRQGNILLPFHSSTFAWKIPWMEGPGRLQSMGSPRVGHDWATSLSLFTFMLWRRKWQPTPVFLPGESQGLGEPCGEPGGLPSMGSHRVGHNWSDLAAAAAGAQKIRWLGTSLVVWWLRICLATQGTPVPSMVGELRSHMPRSN